MFIYVDIEELHFTLTLMTKYLETFSTEMGEICFTDSRYNSVVIANTHNNVK